MNTEGQTKEEFLKVYNAGRYPCPTLSMDMPIFSKYENRLKLLSIRRKNHLYIQRWALSRGFLNIEEDTLDAAYRELKEEASIEHNRVQLCQLRAYGAAHRGPRMHVIFAAHTALIDQGIKVGAKDDANNAAWLEIQINSNTFTLYHARHRMQYHMKTACSIDPDQEALAFGYIQMTLDALHPLTLLSII